jgi:hypothetical protein
VPDPLGFQRRLSIGTDLRVEVDDGGRLTTAHLRDEPAGLVLEMDQPAALLAAVSWRRLAGRLPVRPPRDLVDGVSVRLRSHGRDLGRVRLTPTGRIRIRPTPAGLVAVVAADLTSRRRSLAYAGGAAAAVALATTLVRLRSRWRPLS